MSLRLFYQKKFLQIAIDGSGEKKDELRLGEDTEKEKGRKIAKRRKANNQGPV